MSVETEIQATNGTDNGGGQRTTKAQRQIKFLLSSGLSRAEVAHRLGISESYVSMILRGRYAVSLSLQDDIGTLTREVFRGRRQPKSDLTEGGTDTQEPTITSTRSLADVVRDLTTPTLSSPLTETETRLILAIRSDSRVEQAVADALVQFTS